MIAPTFKYAVLLIVCDCNQFKPAQIYTVLSGIIGLCQKWFIYTDIFVEPSLSVRKLLLQRECDRLETRDYCGAPHRECHKGVDGRRDAAPEESAARFPSWTEKDAMFLVGLGGSG